MFRYSVLHALVFMLSLLLLILGIWSFFYLIMHFFPKAGAWYPDGVLSFVHLPDPYLGSLLQTTLAVVILCVTMLLIVATVKYKRELEVDLASLSSSESSYTAPAKDGVGTWILAIVIGAPAAYFFWVNFQDTIPEGWKESVRWWGTWFLTTDARPLGIPVIVPLALWFLPKMIPRAGLYLAGAAGVFMYLYLLGWLVTYLAT